MARGSLTEGRRPGTGGRAKRARWVAGGTAAVLVVALIWWLIGRAGDQPPPRARQYLDYTACLLTDQHGLAGQAAAPIWAAMQDASITAHVRVQYQTPVAAKNPDDVAPYLTSMALSGCNLVFTIDSTAADATDHVAPAYPDIRFFVVGGTHAGHNITVLAGSTEQVAGEVGKAITDASRHPTP